MEKRTRHIAESGIIAALYVVLTMLTTAFGLSNGWIQFRLSEALCILPCFTPAAIPGLFVGCVFANLFSGALLPDVVFGSLATLLGAIGTRVLAKKRYLAPVPPIVSNALVVPLVQALAYKIGIALGWLILSVAVSEMLSCGLLGQILYGALEKRKVFDRK